MYFLCVRSQKSENGERIFPPKASLWQNIHPPATEDPRMLVPLLKDSTVRSWHDEELAGRNETLSGTSSFSFPIFEENASKFPFDPFRVRQSGLPKGRTVASHSAVRVGWMTG